MTPKEIARIRRDYALAHSASLPAYDPTKMRSSEPEEEYVSWWYGIYTGVMTKVASIAEAALTNMARRYDLETIRDHVRQQLNHDPVVAALVNGIQPLQSVLLTDEVDNETFRQTMKLVVDAFGLPAS